MNRLRYLTRTVVCIMLMTALMSPAAVVFAEGETPETQPGGDAGVEVVASPVEDSQPPVETTSEAAAESVDSAETPQDNATTDVAEPAETTSDEADEGAAFVESPPEGSPSDEAEPPETTSEEVDESVISAESAPEAQTVVGVGEESAVGEPPAAEIDVVDEAVADETILVDSTPGEQPAGDEPQAGETTDDEALEEIVGEIIADAADADVSLVPLDQDGEALPLASQEAVETLVNADPYFQDANGNWVGYTKPGGVCDSIVTTCIQVANPVQAAVTAAPAGATVYVEKDTYAENVTINKALTLAGLWQGNEDYANRPTIKGTLTITAAASNVWLHGLIIDAANKVNGLIIRGDNVTVTNSEIKNAGVGISDPNETNVLVDSADSVRIDNNNIHEAPIGSGIVLNNATNATIINNIIQNNGYSAPGPAVFGGIQVFTGDGNETIRNNNIMSNNAGIDASGSAIQVTAVSNYFNGNDVATYNVGDVNNVTPLAAPAALPVYKAGPPAPGGGPGTPPGEDFEPPPYVPKTATKPVITAWQPPACGMGWTSPSGDVPRDGSWHRYFNDVWVSYDTTIGGWVHWVGDNSNKYLRTSGGAWHMLAEDGSKAPVKTMTDANWSLINGEWCVDGSGNWSMLQNCTLYHYANGNFQWARFSDGTVFIFNPVTQEWALET